MSPKITTEDLVKAWEAGRVAGHAEAAQGWFYGGYEKNPYL